MDGTCFFMRPYSKHRIGDERTKINGSWEVKLMTNAQVALVAAIVAVILILVNIQRSRRLRTIRAGVSARAARVRNGVAWRGAIGKAAETGRALPYPTAVGNLWRVGESFRRDSSTILKDR
jgi:hypothetical protein